jgi:hypothetical protein
MTRGYRRPRRITEPLRIPSQPRAGSHPAVRTLGFHCFRLFRIPRTARFDPVAFVDYTNAMSAFAGR